MKEVLEVLKDSTIASKSGKDERSRFWGLYKRVAEEHDDEFLERYSSDMDIVLVFVSFTSSPLPRVVIDVPSVWSVLRRQHDFYRGHGVQSQSGPQRHHACTSHAARTNRTRQLHGSGVYASNASI
jgi:hypothetical protein